MNNESPKQKNYTSLILGIVVSVFILLISLAIIITGRLADESGLRDRLAEYKVTVAEQLEENIEMPSLAVVPFKMDPASDVPVSLVDAITQNISEKLSIEGLRIAHGEVVDQFRDKHVTPAEVGEKLGVRYVLIGGVGGLGEEIRIDTVLHDVVLGMSIFRGSFYGDRMAVVSLHDEVATSLLVVLNNIIN